MQKIQRTFPHIKLQDFFFPRPRQSSTHTEVTLFHQYGIESYKTYLDIISGQHQFIHKGASLLPAYYGRDIDPGFRPLMQAQLMKPPQEVTITFNKQDFYQVHQYSTLFINAIELMHQLHEERKRLEIPIISTEIVNFTDVEEMIIFNCSGLGSRKLVHDPKIIPVQGHLITLKNQPDLAAINYMLHVKVTMLTSKNTLRDELIYYAPKESGILGITFLRGQDSLESNHHEFERLLERCNQFFSQV